MAERKMGVSASVLVPQTITRMVLPMMTTSRSPTPPTSMPTVMPRPDVRLSALFPGVRRFW